MIDQNNTQAATAAPEQAPTSQVPASPPQAAPVHEPAPEMDLSSLLREFDEATKPAEQPAATQQQPDSAPAINPNDPAAFEKASAAYKAALESGVATEGMKARLDNLQQGMGTLYAHMQQQQDRADFQSIVDRGKRELADRGLAVGDDYAKMFFLSHAMENQATQQIFANRYQSKEHLRQAERMVNKLMDKMVSEARKMPDISATQDRMAVAAAVRATSAKIPEPKAPRYSEMTDAEFAKEKAKWGV